MPKLFSNIAKNTQGLAKVYENSSVTSEVLKNIQVDAAESPLSLQVASVDVRRIEKIYNTYDQTHAQNTTFTANPLWVVPPVVTKRQTGFYQTFRTVNTLIPQQSALNNTLIEIKPNGEIVGIPTSAVVPFIGSDEMKQDSRLSPRISGKRDEKRLFNFLTTTPGVLFLARQQVLQGGNTFGQARAYNPLSISLATANYTLSSEFSPLVRVDRALSIDTTNAGRLQIATAIGAQSVLRTKFVGGSAKGSTRTSLLGQVVGTAASRLVQDIINRTNIDVFGKKINLGQVGKTLNTISQTLNAISRAANGANSTLQENQTAYDALYEQNLWPLITEYKTTTKNFTTVKDAYIQRAQTAINEAKAHGILKGNLHGINGFTKPYPNSEDDYRSSATYTDDIQADASRLGQFNGITSAKYMKDPMNYDAQGSPLTNIKDINGTYADLDFIKLKFVVPTVFDGGISFRAFIKDIKHDAKGDYEEQRYVGRPERFIVYKGMSRSVDFTLYLVAFSADELTGVWARANMLNKLVYPIDNSAGSMTAPIIQLTLGNILTNQPGYVTDIAMNLTDMPWDIDSELTQVIELQIKYNIIEKGYITQAQDNLFAEGMDLFANNPLLNTANTTVNTQMKNGLAAAKQAGNTELQNQYQSKGLPSPSTIKIPPIKMPPFEISRNTPPTLTNV